MLRMGRARDQAAADPGATTQRELDAHSQIVALARATPPGHAFYVKAFRAIATSFAAPFAVLHVRTASDVIQDDWHCGPTDPGFWKPGLQEFLTESLAGKGARARLLRARQGGATVAFLSAPIYDAQGSDIGAVALVTPCDGESDASRRLARLESLVRLAGCLADGCGTSRGTSDASASAGTAAMSKAGAVSTAEELAFSITNSLRNKLGCEQVALGLVTGRRVKILSLSGMDSVSERSPGVIHVRAAMEECLDAGEIVACQRDGAWSSATSGAGYAIARQWHAAAGGDAVVCVPLRAGGRVAAVLGLRRRPDQPFAREQVEEIRARVEPFAYPLVVLRIANRGLARHALDLVRDTARAAVAPGRLGRKIAVVAVLAATAWFLFGSMDYQLTVPCRVVPEEVRHVAMPFDGTLAAATVVAGDHVRRGDVLCRIDVKDLLQQRAEIVSRIAVLEREKDRAMAANEPANVQLAQANQELGRAELEILDNRIEQASIRAPIDGVVIGGDLRSRIGGTAARGEPLFQIAPLDRWILELSVPETDSDELDTGQVGRFAPHARPEESQDFRLLRIRPSSESREMRNTFVAEACAAIPYAWMRPGMEGTARIRIGSRRVWWIALHGTIDFLRLKLWL